MACVAGVCGERTGPRAPEAAGAGAEARGVRGVGEASSPDEPWAVTSRLCRHAAGTQIAARTPAPRREAGLRSSRGSACRRNVLLPHSAEFLQEARKEPAVPGGAGPGWGVGTPLWLMRPTLGGGARTP